MIEPVWGRDEKRVSVCERARGHCGVREDVEIVPDVRMKRCRMILRVGSNGVVRDYSRILMF